MDAARRLASLLTLGLMLLLAAPAASHAAAGDTYPERIGVGTHLRFFEQKDIQSEFARLRTGGVTWVREDFSWASIEPQPGVEDWGNTDKLMAAAAIEGIDILALVSTSPAWMSSDPTGAGDKLYPPRDPAAFANFMSRVVARYGANGAFWNARPDLPRRPLKAVEVWNEPWCRCAWKPDPDPAGYANLARQAMQAARATDPSVKLLISGDWFMSRSDRKPVRWLEALLEADPTLYTLADAWVVHPYPGPRYLGPYDESNGVLWSYGRVKVIRDFLVQKRAALPIWITEMGWSTGADDPERVTESTQAVFTGGAIQRGLGDWGGFVEKVFIYSWGRTGQSSGERDFALRRFDNSPRPAWDAIVSLAGGRIPEPSTPQDQRPGSGSRGGGERGDDATVVETVVLTPRDLDALTPAELRESSSGRFFSDLDVRRRQSSKLTSRSGLHLTIACAPQCLVDTDVFMRIRSKGRTRPELIGRTRFTVPVPGRADVIISLTRQARRRIAKYPNSHVYLYATYNGLTGERDKYARSVKFKK